jgi:hypothetical protein
MRIAVLIGQIVIGNQQEIDFMSRQFMANFADHVHKYAVIERNRMNRKHQPDGIDFAHLQTAGEGVRPVTRRWASASTRARVSLETSSYPFRARLTVVTDSPSSLAMALSDMIFRIFVSFVPPPAARGYPAPAP